jgi:sugar lactone lactonase YvrE
VAVDSSGNIYIADTYNERIRKVSTSGIITTVAGNGAATFSGDGGAATSAELHGPSGVAVDSSGNIYIADTYNERIRKVSTSGIITTVAGNGTGGYSGDGGAATSAELYYPSGVAVDSSGNIYIADRNNDRIREVSTSGIITTVAGNGTWGYSGDSGAATSAELYGPSGVAVDSSGNIFFVEDGNNRVRKVSASGIITTVAGNGTGGYSGDGGVATSAELYTPYGVAVDSSGNIYIADLNNNRIRKVFH